MNISEVFISAVDEVQKKPIPENVMARARQSLLDYLAVTCAGAEFQKDKLERYFEFASPETGSFRAIGTGKDLALKEAVFLNGLNGSGVTVEKVYTEFFELIYYYEGKKDQKLQLFWERKDAISHAIKLCGYFAINHRLRWRLLKRWGCKKQGQLQETVQWR